MPRVKSTASHPNASHPKSVLQVLVSVALGITIGTLVAPLAAPLAAEAAPPRQVSTLSASETLRDFRSYASKIKTLKMADVLYDRFQRYGQPRYSASGMEVFKEIDSPVYSKSNLLALLKDGDAKVRTIAICALYAREDATVLPDIVALAEDPAKTYPEPMDFAGAMQTGRDGKSAMTIPTQDKTVGQVAQDVVRFYMEPAGYYYGIKGVSREPGFDKYWAEHKNRKSCASWYVVKLARAATGTSPSDRTRTPECQKLRREIDSLPAPYRYWLLLWLSSSTGFDTIATKADLLTAMRKIGPDDLLLMVQRKLQFADPDLRPRPRSNYLYKQMQTLALQHAASVLKPSQIEAILACQRDEADYQKQGRSDPLISPWFTIAAASLDHSRAHDLLHGQFNNMPEDFYGFQKADVAAALFTICGSSESDYLLDRFYEPTSLVINGQQSQFRAEWLKQLPSTATTGALLHRLVADKRFDQLDDCAALLAISDLASQIKGKELISRNLREKAWHPLGIQRACIDLSTARKAYPAETDELIKRLAQFRDVLKKNI